MPIELTQINSSQFQALSRATTVFFFAVGPLEDHGPHLPLGLDLQEARFLGWKAAQELEKQMPGWSGVIMPEAALGIEANTSQIVITVRAHVLRDWLVDSCRCLIRCGFFHFVCFTGHLGPRQLTAIEEAGKIIGRAQWWNPRSAPFFVPKKIRPTLLSAQSGSISWKEVLTSPFWPDPKEHGGERDTSVALAISEGLVSPIFQDLPRVNRLSSRWIRNFSRRMGRLSGYWGDPSVAHPKQGEIEMAQSVEVLFPKFKVVWEGHRPQSLFRSWYSILPPNQSFFKAWLLFALILLFLAGWSFLSALTYHLD